jgi:predicted nucleic acid-binding protein
VIVLDANVVVLALVSTTDRGRAARETIGVQQRLAAPDFVGVEVANALRLLAERRELSHGSADAAFGDFQELDIHLARSQDLLDRVWSLRRSMTSYDAAYVATAELLGCALVTADERITRSGATMRCPVQTLRS